MPNLTLKLSIITQAIPVAIIRVRNKKCEECIQTSSHKMLIKLTHVVNFTNIIHFGSSFAKKL